jgi:small subunit ribosomal protein S3
MGQKVNPVGLRLGYNKTWLSHWFTPDKYAKNLEEDNRIRAMIMKRHARAGIDHISINRQRGEVVVTISTAKPGILIGRSGSGSQELKANIERLVQKNRDSRDKQLVRLNIVEMKNPETSARLVAETISGQIERRIAIKRAIRQAIERAMEKRVQGIKIRVSGRLGGAEIARSESASAGSIPLQTMRSNVDYALAEAKTTYGVVGVKVWVYTGESQEMPHEPVVERSSRQPKHR